MPGRCVKTVRSYPIVSDPIVGLKLPKVKLRVQRICDLEGGMTFDLEGGMACDLEGGMACDPAAGMMPASLVFSFMAGFCFSEIWIL